MVDGAIRHFCRSPFSYLIDLPVILLSLMMYITIKSPLPTCYFRCRDIWALWYGILTLYWSKSGCYGYLLGKRLVEQSIQRRRAGSSIIEWILASAEKFIPRFTRNQSRISTVSPNFHLNYLPAGRSCACPLLKQFFWDTYFFYRVNCFQTFNRNFTFLGILKTVNGFDWEGK